MGEATCHIVRKLALLPNGSRIGWGGRAYRGRGVVKVATQFERIKLFFTSLLLQLDHYKAICDKDFVYILYMCDEIEIVKNLI
jgi:hypothetical protein